MYTYIYIYTYAYIYKLILILILIYTLANSIIRLIGVIYYNAVLHDII